VLQDRPDAPLVKRLVLGEVPVPARYDAPAPGGTPRFLSLASPLLAAEFARIARGERAPPLRTAQYAPPPQ
jgi:hypothetical protein